MVGAVVAIVVGVGLIALAVRLWSHEPFFQYFWDRRSSRAVAKLGPKDAEKARLGIRGALVMQALIGLLLLAFGLASL